MEVIVCVLSRWRLTVILQSQSLQNPNERLQTKMKYIYIYAREFEKRLKFIEYE